MRKNKHEIAFGYGLGKVLLGAVVYLLMRFKGFGGSGLGVLKSGKNTYVLYVFKNCNVNNTRTYTEAPPKGHRQNSETPEDQKTTKNRSIGYASKGNVLGYRV